MLGAECCWWPPWGSICGVAVIRAEPCQSTVYRVPRRVQVSSLVRLVCFFGVPSGVGWGTSRFSSRGESRFLGSFSTNLLPGGAVLILIKLNCTGSFFFFAQGGGDDECANEDNGLSNQFGELSGRRAVKKEEICVLKCPSKEGLNEKVFLSSGEKFAFFAKWFPVKCWNEVQKRIPAIQ